MPGILWLVWNLLRYFNHPIKKAKLPQVSNLRLPKNAHCAALKCLLMQEFAQLAEKTLSMKSMTIFIEWQIQ